MTYQELKEKNRKEMNNFTGIFFAFNNDQFKEGMEKIGLTVEQTKEIYSLGGGGYILKTKSKDFHERLSRFDEELKELRKNEKEMLSALVYELQNHEYCISGDIGPALDALGWEKENLDPKLLKKAMSLAI